MKLLVLILILNGLVSLKLKAETCDITPTQLIAKYQIKQLDHQGQLQKSRLDLYRYDHAVGHYFPEQNYGDWWTKSQSDQLMLMRYFPKYHRAIEYQAEDIKSKEVFKASFWQKKQQLIATSLLAKMNVEQVTGQGCYQVEILSLKDKGKKYQVRWLPRLQLIERFDVSKGSKMLTSWRLQDIVNDEAHIQTYATNIHRYQTTDYADIGDNEQDPFLAKMIHQGFMLKADTQTPHHEHNH